MAMHQFFLKMFVALQTARLGVRQDSERGATAVEYSLLVSLIAAVIVGVVATLGGQVTVLFDAISAVWP
jgi:pilus assembly protein Flp/PilA